MLATPRTSRGSSLPYLLRYNGLAFRNRVVHDTLRRPRTPLMNDSDRLNRDKAVLRDREDSMRLIIESLQEYAILLLDATGRSATWNTGAERMRGHLAAACTGKPFS